MEKKSAKAYELCRFDDRMKKEKEMVISPFISLFVSPPPVLVKRGCLLGCLDSRKKLKVERLRFKKTFPAGIVFQRLFTGSRCVGPWNWERAL